MLFWAEDIVGLRKNQFLKGENAKWEQVRRRHRFFKLFNCLIV